MIFEKVMICPSCIYSKAHVEMVTYLCIESLPAVVQIEEYLTLKKTLLEQHLYSC